MAAVDWYSSNCPSQKDWGLSWFQVEVVSWNPAAGVLLSGKVHLREADTVLLPSEQCLEAVYGIITFGSVEL